MLWLYGTRLHGIIPPELPLPFAYDARRQCAYDTEGNLLSRTEICNGILPPGSDEFSLTLKGPNPFQLTMLGPDGKGLLQIAQTTFPYQTLCSWVIIRIKHNGSQIMGTRVPEIIKALHNAAEQPVTIHLVTCSKLRLMMTQHEEQQMAKLMQLLC